MAKKEVRHLSENRKAYHEYFVSDTLECGISLQGTEVKSVKSGRFSFTDCYAKIKDGELYLVNFHISPYPFASFESHEPDRVRKLLVHRDEIKRLKRKVDEKGFTLIPVKCYLKGGLVKIELGICQGKKLYDKRETIRAKDQRRDAEREMRGRY